MLLARMATTRATTARLTVVSGVPRLRRSAVDVLDILASNKVMSSL
jgi:hypothetical protein